MNMVKITLSDMLGVQMTDSEGSYEYGKNHSIGHVGCSDD